MFGGVRWDHVLLARVTENQTDTHMAPEMEAGIVLGCTPLYITPPPSSTLNLGYLRITRLAEPMRLCGGFSCLAYIIGTMEGSLGIRAEDSRS